MFFKIYTTICIILALGLMACSTGAKLVRTHSSTGTQEYEAINGIPNGISRNFYLDGRVMFEMYRQDGSRNGPMRGWYPNGRLAIQGAYKNRSPIGIWTRWYSTGERWTEGEFKEGLLNGIWITWNQSGKEIAREFFTPQMSHNTDIGLNIGAKPPKGISLRVESFTADGQLRGIETDWYPDGAKWFEVGYLGNFVEGEGMEWYEDGKVSRQGRYQQGVPTGVFIFWHPNGIRQAEVIYESGNAKVLKSWDTEGKPLVTGSEK